jgi:hypothetical protein
VYTAHKIIANIIKSNNKSILINKFQQKMREIFSYKKAIVLVMLTCSSLRHLTRIK